MVVGGMVLMGLQPSTLGCAPVLATGNKVSAFFCCCCFLLCSLWPSRAVCCRPVCSIFVKCDPS